MSNKKFYLFISMVIVLALVLVGCGGDGSGGGNGSGGGSSSSAALTISGMVNNEMSWTEDEVHAMDTIDAVSTNNSGEESTYTGVSINTLLDEAGVQDGASAVVFVTDDGTEAEVSLDEIRSCADCILSFRNRGGFSSVLPGFPGNMQVKGVIEIKVQ